MEDFIIELLARLNTALSANQINNRDLPALEAMLKKIKITASLDNSKTAQQINKGVTQCQNQIKTLKINGKIDDNSMNKSVDRIVSKIENKSPKLKLNYGIEGINETGQTVTENINKGLRNSYIKNRIMWAAGREILSQFTNAINTLKEVDTILTEISKTSDRTETSLKNLGETAFDTASEYGRTVQDYLTGIQEFARAGFDESGQEAMAKLSLQAQSAGDMTADLANEYLLVTNAAYKLKGSEEELSKVLDSQNYITNHNAVNMSEYANGMKVVAAQAASAGVKINELSALLGTAMSANQLGGSLNARGLKGILMNLQQVTGVDEEGESITEEDLTKYENACRALGVSLTEVKNGLVQLRNPVQILKELSQSYMQLDESDVKRANLINAVGGKYRGHVLNDILSNWDTYEKMLSEYSQGEGSAMREAEKTANSWEGRLNSLKNSWTSFVQNFVNSDIAKSTLTSTESFVKLVDKLSELNVLLPSLGAGIMTFYSVFSKGGGLTQLFDKSGNLAPKGNLFGINLTSITEQKAHFREAGQAIELYNQYTAKGVNYGEKFTITAIEQNKSLKDYLATTKGGTASLAGYKASLESAGVATGALQLKTLALNAAVGLGIGLVVQLAMSGIQYIVNYQNSLEQALSDSKDSLSQAQEETKSLNDELKTTQQRIDELNGKEKLTLTEEGELERLKQQNAELKKKIELSELAEKQANKEVNEKFVETMDSDLKSNSVSSFTYDKLADYGSKTAQSKRHYSYSDSRATKNDSVSEEEYIKMNFEALDALKDKLYKASTQKEKDNIQKQLDEVEKYLSDKQTELKTRSEGRTYIDNPQNDKEKSLNAWLDYIDDFNNQMLIKLGDTDSINAVWENLWTSDKYSDATSKLKELSEQGKLTSESIKTLAESDSVVKTFIDKLKELGLINTDNLDTIANQINGITDSVDNATSERIAEKSFSDIYEEIKDKAKLVATAEKEMSDNGVIATDTMIDLIDKGLATEDQFTQTAKGFTLSKTALQNLNNVAIKSYQNDLNNAKKAANAVIEAEGGKALAISATTDEYEKQLMTILAANQVVSKDFVGPLMVGWSVGTDAEVNKRTEIEKLLSSIRNADSNYKTVQKLFDSIENDVKNSGKSSSKNKTAGDLALEAWEAKKKAWKHKLEMGQMSEADYHYTLHVNYKKDLKNYSETLDERRAMEEDWYKWQVTNAQNTWNLNNNTWKHQLEMGEITEATYYATVKKYYKKILGNYKDTLDQRRQIEEELHQWEITNAQNTWNEQNNAKKHALTMGEITEKQYYDWVKANYKKILGTYKETLDERRSIEEDYYGWVTEQETKRLELIQTKLDGAKSAIDDLLEEEIDRLNEQKDAVEKAYQAEIDALQEKNEAKEKEIDLEEKALALAKSRNQRTVMQYTAQGMRYVADKTEVKSAQKDYDDALLQQKIDYLEQQKENASQAFESQIEVYNQYKDLWQDAVDAQQKAQNKMYANTQLWANWEQAALQGNIDLLNDFIDKYNQASKNVALDAVKNNNSDLTKAEVNTKYTLIPDVVDATKLQTAMADFKDSINTLINGNLKKITEEFNTSQSITTKATSNVFNGGITINKPISDVDSLSRAIIEKLPMYMSQYCGS